MSISIQEQILYMQAFTSSDEINETDLDMGFAILATLKDYDRMKEEDNEVCKYVYNEDLEVYECTHSLSSFSSKRGISYCPECGKIIEFVEE